MTGKVGTGITGKVGTGMREMTSLMTNRPSTRLDDHTVIPDLMTTPSSPT